MFGVPYRHPLHRLVVETLLCEHMKLPLEIIPDEIIQQYKLQDLSRKGFLNMEIPKVNYGMPQAAKTFNHKLKLHLAKF